MTDTLSEQVTASERVTVVTGGVVEIGSVRLSDAGIYSCNASNSLGTAESDSSIMLRVYCESLGVLCLPATAI